MQPELIIDSSELNSKRLSHKIRLDMTARIIVAISIAVILVIAAGGATWIFGFFMLAVALNGFVGKPTAVEVSMYGYMILAAVAVLIVAMLTGMTTYMLMKRRKWNAAGACALTTVLGILCTGVLHFICFVLAVITTVALYR